jgi:toxin YoeB
MEIIYLPQAEEDLDFWIKTGNKIILKKIAQLTEAIIENPFQGIGKPESLKYDLAGKWSRRISHEHRFIYSIVDNTLFVYSLRDHYRK